MSRKYFRAVVYEPDDTTVDFTIDHDDFTAWPARFGGQRVNLLESKVESLPFTFAFRAAGFQDKIVEGDRPVVLQRRVQFQRKTGSTAGAWNDIGGGRFQQLEQGENLEYTATCMDERWIERNTVIFAEADTCAIWPPDQTVIHDRRPHIVSAGYIRTRVLEATTGGNARLRFNPDDFTDRVRDIIDDDLRPGDEARSLGNTEARYRHLTLHIIGNSTSDTAEGDYRVREFHETFSVQLSGAGITVRDPAGTLSASTELRRAYFYLPKAPPSDDVPLHVPKDTTFRFDGTIVGGFARGLHPFQLVKDIYDGSYQQTVVAGTTKTVSPRTVRYSADTLASYTTGAKERLIDNPTYPIVRYRITESETMASFLDRAVFAPFGVLPVIDASGRVKLTDFKLPSAETVGTTGLFSFTESNLAAPPTWLHGSRDQVTSIRFRYPRHLPGTVFQSGLQDAWSGDIRLPTDTAGMDRIEAKVHEEEYRHARLDAGELLRREIIRDMPGTDNRSGGHSVADVSSAELFERYGDGPQTSRLQATTAASTVLPGDLVLVGIKAFPNTANSTRGGTVLMQVTARIPRVDGYSFDAIHVGANLQPLPTPTVDLQRSGADPRHTLRFSVSGYASTNDTAVYQLADSTATPNSTDWKIVGTNKAARVLDVGDLKSGTKWWGRARLIREGRVGSLWSAADSTSTDPLSPPTALQSTKQGATYIDLSWSNGEDDQSVEVLNPTNVRASLAPGSDRYRDIELTVGTTHAYRVRHRDPFGGVSAPTTKLSVATSTDASDVLQLSAPELVRIVFGDSITSAT